MPVTLLEIATSLGATCVGDTSIAIVGASEPATANADELALAMDPKFAAGLGEGKARCAVLWPDADWQSLGLQAAIFVDKPRYAMSGISAVFEVRPSVAPGIHPSAVVNPTARIGAGCAIGPFCLVGAGAVIGDNCTLVSHVSLGADVRIGDGALLHSGVRIADRVEIGANFRAHSNSVVGADGFSFVTPEPDAVAEVRSTLGKERSANQTEYVRIASLGSVIIGDNVEMGANCTIDRGTVANTTIGDGAKLDNLVHVGHNVSVGCHTLLCGQVGIAGSSEIGDRVILAGQCGVGDHTRVGHDVIAGGATKIFANVPNGRVILGSPAMKMDQNIQVYKALRRLPRFMEEMKNFQKSVSNQRKNE
jgi:UDP-3-O-[3-hydroxymyristoyl] glucosamine N-acyltransferase